MQRMPPPKSGKKLGEDGHNYHEALFPTLSSEMFGVHLSLRKAGGEKNTIRAMGKSLSTKHLKQRHNSVQLFQRVKQRIIFPTQFKTDVNPQFVVSLEQIRCSYHGGGLKARRSEGKRLEEVFYPRLWVRGLIKCRYLHLPSARRGSDCESQMWSKDAPSG